MYLVGVQTEQMDRMELHDGILIARTVSSFIFCSLPRGPEAMVRSDFGSVLPHVLHVPGLTRPALFADAL